VPYSSSAKPLKVCVLIVDDSEGDRRLMRELLSKAGEAIPALKIGFDAFEAASLDEAIMMLEAGPCDLVLLDASLPPHEGTEGLIELRAHFPWLPVIMVSGNESEELALRAASDGAEDYILKTEVSAKRIIRAIRFALERTRSLLWGMPPHLKPPEGKEGDVLYDIENLKRLREIAVRLR
jgi:CheY-like chemotaxis protein